MSKNVLVVSLDDNVFKIISGEFGKKGWRIKKSAAEIVTGKTGEELVGVIKETIRKNSIKKSHTIFIIPRNQVTVRYIQLPSVKEAEIKNMIDMQISRYVPFSKEEINYDYYVSGVTNEGYSRILLIVVNKEASSKYLTTLEKAELLPDSVELDVFALAELYRFMSGKDSNFAVTDKNKAVALLDVDYSFTNVSVVKDGVPVFTRAFAAGNMHFAGEAQGGKDWNAEWIGEVTRSLGAYAKEAGASVIEKAVVTGKCDEAQLSSIREKIGLPVHILDVKNFIQGESFSSAENAGVSMLSLLGAVKESFSTSVNLIPEDKKILILKRNRQKSLMVTGFLVLSIIAVLGFTFAKKIQDRKEYLSDIEKQLKDNDPIAKELGVKKDRLALIERQLSVDGTSLDLLRELYLIIPQKTALNVFIYDEAQGVTIKGASPSMSEVFDLIPKLENSPYYEDVTNRYATQRKIKGQELTEFHIDCSVSKDKGE